MVHDAHEGVECKEGGGLPQCHLEVFQALLSRHIAGRHRPSDLCSHLRRHRSIGGQQQRAVESARVAADGLLRQSGQVAICQITAAAEYGVHGRC